MPVSDKMRRRARRTVFSLLTSVAFLAAATWVERSRNANEEYAVYSAYLSDGLLNDAHDWSVGGRVQVVIEDTTRVGGNLRLRALYVLDSGFNSTNQGPPLRASFLFRT